MKNFKILILGEKNCGKDTLAEFLRDTFNIPFKSSSRFALEKFMFDELKDKYNYQTIEEAFEDKEREGSGMREVWFNLIKAYNTPDKIRLLKEALIESDIYAGMRRKESVQQAIDEEIVDYIIWVDASLRVKPESKSSCTITKDQAQILIDNNSDSPEHMFKSAYKLFKTLGYKPVVELNF